MNTTLRALVNQAERLVRTEAYEEAIALCHAILRRHPRYARAYRILAEAHLGLGEHGTAADLFRRALGVDPEDPVGYAGLGIIFAERGLREEAIWQLERAFELVPGRDGLRRELGRLYEERGSATEVQLTRAALARLYTRGGLWNKAIGELRDLVAREPYRLDLRATLVRTLWRAGQREEAARVAQTVLDQAPNCLVARLVLGAYWCEEGRDDEGRRLLEGARELDPEGREVGRLLRKAWPQLLGVEGREAEAEEPELEEPAEPAIPEPEPPEESGLPPWLETDEATGGHIATLPGALTRALLGSLPEEDEEDLEPEGDEVPPFAEPEEAPTEAPEEPPAARPAQVQWPPFGTGHAWPVGNAARDDRRPEETAQASTVSGTAQDEAPAEEAEQAPPDDTAEVEVRAEEAEQAWPAVTPVQVEVPPEEPVQTWPAVTPVHDEVPPEEAEQTWPAVTPAHDEAPPEEPVQTWPAVTPVHDEVPPEEAEQTWPAVTPAHDEAPREEAEQTWPAVTPAHDEMPPEEAEQTWPAVAPVHDEAPREEAERAWWVGDTAQEEPTHEEVEQASPAADASQEEPPQEVIEQSSRAVDTPQVEEAPAQAEPPQVEETPAEAEPSPPMRDRAQVEAPPPPERAAPFGPDAPSPLLAPVAVWQRRLDAAPEDHDARLALARALVESGRLGEALPHYDTLSTQPAYLQQVLADLEAATRVNASDRLLREHLGDAYARAGRFQDALRMYHWHPAPPDSNHNAAGG